MWTEVHVDTSLTYIYEAPSNHPVWSACLRHHSEGVFGLLFLAMIHEAFSIINEQWLAPGFSKYSHIFTDIMLGSYKGEIYCSFCATGWWWCFTNVFFFLRTLINWLHDQSHWWLSVSQDPLSSVAHLLSYWKVIVSSIYPHEDRMLSFRFGIS